VCSILLPPPPNRAAASPPKLELTDLPSGVWGVALLRLLHPREALALSQCSQALRRLFMQARARFVYACVSTSDLTSC
jgi:hypothetical protein